MKKPQNASVHVNISSLVYDTPAPGGVWGGQQPLHIVSVSPISFCRAEQQV